MVGAVRRRRQQQLHPDPRRHQLTLQWSRSVKGELGAAPALGSTGYLAVNGQTAGGCSLMVWENNNNGRQRWCTRMVLGGGFASPCSTGSTTSTSASPA